MIKHILTFSLAVWLCACAGGQLRQIPTEVRGHKKVDFFAAGHTQAGFRVVGKMNDMELEGLLIIKKIGAEDFDVSVVTGAAYRLMQATVTSQGIAYRYLFKDADTPLIRARISQLLNVLLTDPGVYQRRQVKKDQLSIYYKNAGATTRLSYRAEDIYPYAAQTSTLLNNADLWYNQYAPAQAEGDLQLPHEMVYKDGKIEISLMLVSLK